MLSTIRTIARAVKHRRRVLASLDTWDRQEAHRRRVLAMIDEWVEQGAPVLIAETEKVLAVEALDGGLS